MKEMTADALCLVLREPLGRDPLLERMVAALARAGRCPAGDSPGVLAEILRREASASTAFGLGVAIPHCFLQGVGGPHLAIACSKEGVDFGASDGRLTYVVFLLLEDLAARAAHTAVISRVARLCRETPLVRRLRGATEAGAIPAILADEEARLD
jgi:mannitol/fructose-specific phosphotransferase system IIA component (Ntr-type)